VFRESRQWLRRAGSVWGEELQIPPLRFAPVGMTKGRGVTFRKVSDLDFAEKV
jgi:hypothetical protein